MIYYKTKKLKKAIKYNQEYLKTNPSPHQRDLARMRIKILKITVKELY